MAQINVTNLTFCYEGSFDNIFEGASFSIDTSWRLGFIGRNGKGKTTFLRLLRGEYGYQGSISASVRFDYFPYVLSAGMPAREAAELMGEWKPGCELWRVLCELSDLHVDPEVLYRPFETLSFGERTKVMLAVLFSGENDFLLIDEPTNHLDQSARELVKTYLAGKRGFILVSHDRDLLDACVDHVLVLNRGTIEVQSGNFSSWWDNKSKKDSFARMENEKHLKEIGKLKKASERNRQWAEQNERTKIGFDPVKEHDRCISTRAYIGAKTKKLQSRVGQIEGRIQREIEQKEGLLQDIENPADLKLMPLKHHKERLILARDCCLRYPDAQMPVLQNFQFELMQGERVFLHGDNGCGKSSFIKEVLRRCGYREGQASEAILESGILELAAGLKISYIDQNTAKLQGSIQNFCKEQCLQESLFCALLRQLDMERVQFSKRMEEFSEGQKKKVLIAASLMTPAHLYIWDEPLNYVDVFSRIQIEKLILQYQPTMLLVEHDVRFRERVGTRTVGIIR